MRDYLSLLIISVVCCVSKKVESQTGSVRLRFKDRQTWCIIVWLTDAKLCKTNDKTLFHSKVVNLFCLFFVNVCLIFHSDFRLNVPKYYKCGYLCAIKREKWKPSRWSRLFSRHFKETDYQDRPDVCKQNFKLDAVSMSTYV